MGRDLLPKLGISIQQTKQNGRQINHILDVETGKNIIKWRFKIYPNLCTRLGRSKNHIAKSLFRENHYPNQQKGRRVPLHLLEKVEQELDKLINDKQIVRLNPFKNEKDPRLNLKCPTRPKHLHQLALKRSGRRIKAWAEPH